MVRVSLLCAYWGDQRQRLRLNPAGVSAVLAALCLEEALAQVTRKGDDADADEVVLECA